jgi:predicted tellurium resistance membrane protein TerC
VVAFWDVFLMVFLVAQWVHHFNAPTTRGNYNTSSHITLSQPNIDNDKFLAIIFFRFPENYRYRSRIKGIISISALRRGTLS